MPRYEYKCTHCQDITEVMHSIMDQPEVVCESCNTPRQRIISRNVGIAFKGSGFYVTDSSNQSTTKQPAESKK